MNSKGGKPNPGTPRDRRLSENKPDAGKKPAQSNPAPKKPKKA